MNTILQNPFRVLGVRANATAPEKLAAKNKIAAYLKVGKQPETELDFSPPLEKILRSQEMLELKANEILSDQERVVYSIFWFISSGTIDEIGFEALKSKNYEKALTSFEKGCNNNQFNEKSVTSNINHSSLEIIFFGTHLDETRLKNALNIKLSIAGSDAFLSHLMQHLSVQNPLVNAASIRPTVIEKMKEILFGLFPKRDQDKLFMDYFGEQRELLSEYLDKKAQKIIQQIKSTVSETEAQRNKLIEEYYSTKNLDFGSQIYSGVKLGNNLLSNTLPLIKELKSICGRNHVSTSTAYNLVLEELNYCGLVFFNMFFDAIKNMSDANRKRCIRSVDDIHILYIVQMNENAINELSDIQIPILDTIRDNINSYKEFAEIIKKAKSNSSSASSDEGGQCALYIIIAIIIILIKTCNS